ncbi:MAG: Ribosome hibernation promoting factor Hpf [uncultured Thermomicrobiales bacterium]|uniref:Ribosome hibernation promoting factor n=1 Tax=uncultured Thermomicrobiales bacterium TaxID=1645740 RepID=A0A6J4TWR4_9BACT|nr:MAG: Ribosome hibernation promoting factor Hpf [uncultured Thermomicrobiales bacterium]
MAIQIRGNGITVSDEVREFAEQRVTRLDRLVPKIDERKLELRHNHTRSGPDTVTAQVTVQTGRTLLRAEESDPDVKLAIDRAVDKLVGQVRKVHSKRSRRSNGGDSVRLAETLAPDHVIEEASSTSDFDDIDDGDEAIGAVVRTKRFVLKPMDVDEAIERMELLGHDFFLFQSTDEQTFCVVYRRRGGDYGLLVPDRG